MRRSAGAFVVGSGSESGSGVGRFTRGAFGGANDFALPNAGAGSAGSAIAGRACSSPPPRRNARATFSVSERDGFAGRLSTASASAGRVSRLFAFGAPSADAASTAAVAVPFFVCFAITSRRCRSRRRSSRHSWNASTPRSSASLIDPAIAPEKRPKENCVDMMIERKISVSSTIIEPVRFR